MIAFTNGTKAERTREITDFAWCSSRKMDAVGNTKIGSRARVRVRCWANHLPCLLPGR